MKCISLWQPWASLIAYGYKQYETRGWQADYRGRLLIHAAKKRSKEIDRLVASDPHFQRFFELERLQGIDDLPLGAIVCTCTLESIHPAVQQFRERLTGQELAFGDYTPGRFAWKLSGVVRLETPIPFVGRQGLFEVTGQEMALYAGS